MTPTEPADRQCTRYRRLGARCTNRTTAADGWCRQSDCPGYVRPRPDDTPDQVDRSAPLGTRRQIAATGSRPVPLDIDEVDDVGISRTARESFRRHHRGTDEEATAQLRMMLEDFLLSGARLSSRAHIMLSRGGYSLILDSGMHVITGYRTVHRERTWEQVKAGVPSRYGKRAHRRAEQAQPPE